MDGQRFDEFARLVANGVPRRRVLGMIAGGVAALGARITSVGAQVCAAENETCGVVPAGDVVLECCEGLECIDNVCVPIEPTCADVGEPCSDLAGREPVCCANLICVQGVCEVPEPVCGEIGDPCGLTQGADGCCDGLVCVEGVCEEPEPVCAELGFFCGGKAAVECCNGLECVDSVCIEPEPTCAAAGESCSVAAGDDLACCEGLDCFDGICVPPPNGCADEGEACELDDNCCAGICCAGFCRDIECCIDDPSPNDRCDDGQTCNEGICEGVTEICESDDDCAADTCCCEDGGCSEDCCDDPVTQLPDTGVGQGVGRSSGWMAAAAGAAAAFLAGKKIRENPDTAAAIETAE